jgi:hypothetical protein
VLVFEAVFADTVLNAHDRFAFVDDSAANEAEWIALEWFGTQGETMFPVGLIEQKKASASGRD